MGATAKEAETSSARRKLALSPERRLDAIADLLIHGLARVLMAQDAAHPPDDEVHVNTSEIVSSQDPADAQGGRAR